MLADLYVTVLTVHSYLRWLVLLAAVAAVLCALSGLLMGRPFRRLTGAVYTGLLDLQLLIGIYLYATSPIVRTALANMSVAMKQKELRFFAVEHLTAMLLAVILAHVGSARSKRATEGKSACSRALIWYAASLIVLLGGIPWWRPLFRAL